jgi:hypothetical protein
MRSAPFEVPRDVRVASYSLDDCLSSREEGRRIWDWDNCSCLFLFLFLEEQDKGGRAIAGMHETWGTVIDDGRGGGA